MLHSLTHRYSRLGSLRSFLLTSHYHIHTSTTNKPVMHIAEILPPYPSPTTPLLESFDDDELPPWPGVVALVAAAKSPPVVVGVGVKIVLAIAAVPPEPPVVAALPSIIPESPVVIAPPS